jgi:two-component system, LytTR family, sensor kinase
MPKARHVIHTGIVNEWLLVSQVVGYTAGTVIVVLLFGLVRRAARVEETRPYTLLLWSGLLWNGANLVMAVAFASGVPHAAATIRVAHAFAYAGATLSPAGALMVWRSDRSSPSGTVLVRVSLAIGVALTLSMWSQLLGQHPLGWDTRRLWTLGGYHVATFFAVGALLFYKGHVTTVAARVAIGMTALGAVGVGLSVLLQKGALSGYVRGAQATLVLEVLRQTSTHLMTLGALFFVARFRLADVFVRQSLRLVSAAMLGMLAMAMLVSPMLAAVALAGPHGRAAALAGGALLVAGLMLSFTLVDRLIVSVVDRWLFRQPDYAILLRRLRDELAGERGDARLHAATARLVRDTLALQDARIMPSSLLAPALREGLVQNELLDRAAVSRCSTHGESPAEQMIPIRTSGVVSDVLVVTPSREHPTLLVRELEFLRAAATALGHRLDLVRHEREEIARRTKEAHLQQQLSDATLRALQAQVNPHFLFNTLNTIAHLIQEDPARAEAMTLRLAEVFSHVLASSHRPFCSVSDEVDFLRTYLSIEEARFGDRLSVAFVIDEAAAHATIPSLILQPAVENALKHGLARKIGPGRLTISAAVDGLFLRLSVEDDGVGPAGANGAGQTIARPTTIAGRSPGGLGLRNITARLQTLYADRASLQFEPGSYGGSVVTLRFPLHDHDQKPAD